MENHDIYFSAFQKYYSALKCLKEFGNCGNLFDDISRLDSFFSEFRNITFVIQKALKTTENRNIYRKLQEQYLSGETLKWFVSTRNQTTKEHPFSLKKELIVDVYLPNAIHRIANNNFSVDFDKGFNDILTILKRIFIERFGMSELHFSSNLIFTDNDTQIDFYPKIKSGILQMNSFLKELGTYFLCGCEICRSVTVSIEPIYEYLIIKDIAFKRDYTYEGDLVSGDTVETYLSKNDDSEKHPISSLRVSLDNDIYRDVMDCTRRMFYKFTLMHLWMYKSQNLNIMPVFMVVYSDNTFRMIPFMASIKTTYYRKAKEITELPDFKEIETIFFCGEHYYYDKDTFIAVSDKKYSDRIKMASGERFMCAMISKNKPNLTISFDASMVNDDNYIQQCLRSPSSEYSDYFWFNLIKGTS